MLLTGQRFKFAYGEGTAGFIELAGGAASLGREAGITGACLQNLKLLVTGGILGTHLLLTVRACLIERSGRRRGPSRATGGRKIGRNGLRLRAGNVQ